MTTILLDAYDSFTYNLYQYLNQAGAHQVLVFRNDQITLEEIQSLNPTNIVLSPGPGHPREDPGICYEVLEHYQGKIPILGVCLGQQMMYEHYGGSVGYAGEIQHGKTAQVTHDHQGLYHGLDQEFPVTRYHSLAADPQTLPPDLVITSWTARGVVMGVRHRKYTVEGVQYHPESILSQNGLKMFSNFLKLRGGLWEDNPGMVSGEASRYPGLSLDSRPLEEARDGDILARIFAQRQRDVRQAQQQPGRSMAQLERLLKLGIAPKPLDFVERIQLPGGKKLAVLAEIKRASPSKGDIAADAVAAEQALLYARAGAAAISVLTEPAWFKGSLQDLREARQAVEQLEDRPAVLRKDFVFSRYQVAEARLAGADTVLLIVKMLSRETLAELLEYARALGMEPLVEVNTEEEMRAAREATARVVGINNRDLRTFEVDMETTCRLAAGSGGQQQVLVALSGMASPQDARLYRKTPQVKAVLVGEALMRAEDPKAFIGEM